MTKHVSSYSIPRTAIAAIIAIPFIVPFLFLISTAFRTPADYQSDPGGLPKSFTLDNLTQAWSEANLGHALLMSLILCVVSCAVCASSALLAAFWFRLRTSRGASVGKLVLAAGYAIPMIAWLIPVFVITANLGWTNNIFVAGVVIGVSTLPFALYLLDAFFRQVLTWELLEAVTLDGAGIWRAFWSIAVPMAGPALASVLALCFVWSFGDLLLAATMLQGNPDVYTLTLASTTLSTRESVNLQGQAAAALVSLVPVLVIFAFAQKALGAGFGAGSEK